MNNVDINTFITNDPIIVTYEEELDWINRHQEDYTFSMITENEEFIGNCSFHEIENGSGEIGIILSPEFQNIGLGTEAITFLINYGFDILNLEEIRLVVFSHNERAIRCYQRLGFEEYNRITAVTTRNNEPVDDIYMRLRRN